MWDMRRSIDPKVFPSHRVVVQFEYPDAPPGGQHWWLVSDNGEIDLCLNNHGYDVDVIITSSLKVMTGVWTCQQTFQDAVNKGDIKVIGDPKLTQKLQEWLRASALSKLGTLNQSPELNWTMN